MSVTAIERVLWEMGNKESRVEEFKADPDAYLATRDLSDTERQWLKEMDVKSLVDHGVSSMLTMMAWPAKFIGTRIVSLATGEGSGWSRV